jgi:hypothetical protein
MKSGDVHPLVRNETPAFDWEGYSDKERSNRKVEKTTH